MSSHIMFWNWFKENHPHLENQLELLYGEGLFLEFQTQLDNYCPNLSFAIKGPSRNNKKHKLTITAGEDRSIALKINYLISKAPKIPNWKFAAKIQPMRNLDKIIDGTDPLYEFGDFKIKISDLMFTPTNYCPITEVFDITVYLHGFWKHPHELLNQAVTIMLEDLLGDHLAYSKINRLTLEQIPKNTDALIPLHDMEYLFRTFTLE